MVGLASAWARIYDGLEGESWVEFVQLYLYSFELLVLLLVLVLKQVSEALGGAHSTAVLRGGCPCSWWSQFCIKAWFLFLMGNHVADFLSIIYKNFSKIQFFASVYLL